MKLILSGLRLETCVIYLDHVIVYGNVRRGTATLRGGFLTV